MPGSNGRQTARRGVAKARSDPPRSGRAEGADESRQVQRQLYGKIQTKPARRRRMTSRRRARLQDFEVRNGVARACVLKKGLRGWRCDRAILLDLIPTERINGSTGHYCAQRRDVGHRPIAEIRDTSSGPSRQLLAAPDERLKTERLVSLLPPKYVTNSSRIHRRRKNCRSADG